MLILISLTVLTGIIYPLLVTGISQVLFRSKANGSLIEKDGKWIGSELIGQSFTGQNYFWGRPSATSPVQYNAAASTGSNLGPSNPALLDAVAARVRALRAADPSQDEPVPVDLVTASGSGLDPHISIQAALYQVPRIARARGIPENDIRMVVERNIESRDLGFFGEPRVNVLRLNLALDNGLLTSKGNH
jgi:K+-transporting ATPase ATPase C chain